MTRTPSQKLLRHHSPWRLATKLLAVAILVGLAYTVRYKVIEGTRVPDNGLAPDLRMSSWVWICKMQRCLDHAAPGTATVFEANPGDFLIRELAAGPGAILQGQTDGSVTAPGFKRHLAEDSWFLDFAMIHVPRKGDSLVFANLAPAEFDLAMRLFRQQEPSAHIQVRPSLWIDGRQVPIERASGSSIHGIPVKLKDLGLYSWQELKLIEMQILRSEYGSSHVHIQREVLRDTTRINGFRTQNDCFFLLCTKGRDCVDSRELGFITRPHIRGVQFNRKMLSKYKLKE